MKRHTLTRRLRKAILGLAFAVTALGSGAAMGVASPPDSHWNTALSTRSDAVDRAQHLAGAPTFRTHAPEPEWKRALRIRSEGLNALYGI